MRAAIITAYGPPDVLRVQEVPEPVPQPSEVLIRQHASVATPPDCAFRSGNPPFVRLFTGLTRPRHPIAGTTVAGEVEAVGSAVTRFAVGDKVYGASDTAFGTCADYKCMAESESIVRLPEGASYAEAAAISEGYLTAMPFLRDAAKLQPGQHILINGASGSVGTAAVELAKHMGAVVTAVCSGRNAELVRDLGADHVVDYTQDDFTKAREVYDAVFDAVGKSRFSKCKRALKPGGVYMTTTPSFHILWTMLTTRRGRGKFGLMATTGLRETPEKTKDLEILNDLIEKGIIRAVIDRRYPLEEIVEAHRYVETERKRGSVVIDIVS